MKQPHAGAHLVAECLTAHGIENIFVIPGAKVDALVDALKEYPIRVIVCRHEQNAAFMAACCGSFLFAKNQILSSLRYSGRSPV